MEIGKLDIDSFLQSLPASAAGKETGSSSKNKRVKESTTGKQQQQKKAKKAVAPPPSPPSDEEEEEEEDEEEVHKRQLQALAETDPEFFESLQNEAKDLLAFGKEQEEEEEEEDEEEEDEEDDQDASTAMFTLAEIQKMDKRASKGETVYVRRLIRAFRDAMLQPMDALPDQDENAAYEHLLRTSLVCIARGLDICLGVTKQNPVPKPNAALAHPIRQLLVCITKVIASKNTSPSVLQHLLQSSRLFCALFVSVAPVEGKKFVSTLISIWGREDTEGPVRLASFFRIRQMCLLDKTEFLSMALRDCYVIFARNAKSFRVDAVKERISLQARCLVELYGIDRDAGYRVAFLHIRQLALHVRSALASKTAESLQSICSWQFMHCLRLWGFILMENDLNNLDFPFLQVALGVLSLFHNSNSTRYLPLQLHCIEIINRLCDKKQLYAPVGMLCLELCTNLVSKKIVPCTDTMTLGEFQSILKFKAESAQHANVRLIVIGQIFAALRQHLVTHRTSVAFPELFAPIARELKDLGQFDKRSQEAWKLNAVKTRDALLKDGEEWAKLVREARQGASKLVPTPPSGPGDLALCDEFRAKLAAHYAAVEQKSKNAAQDALFAMSKNVSLKEPKENAEIKIVRGKPEQQAQDEEEEEEEGVDALDPSDFL